MKRKRTGGLTFEQEEIPSGDFPAGAFSALSLCSGCLFQISGAEQLSIVRNGSFYNIDQGIEPDVVLTQVESFYDREGLVDYLHTIK